MTGRLRVTLFFFVIFFAVIIARLFYWQIVKAEELSFLGQSQYDAFIKIPAKRGEIKTQDGFPLAANTVSYLVFANPREVKDKGKTIDLLASILDIDTATISASLEQPKFWVAIKSGISVKTKEQVEKLHLKGVGFEQQSSRFYPEASISAHLIGFVGKNELGEDRGYFGLEGYYERQLKGKTGIAVQIRDALGRPILSRMNDTSGTIDGRNLILSIDRAIQFTVENKLRKAIEVYGAAGGMIGVLQPQTGNVLAMASYPSFDPREYQNFRDATFKNPFISNLYEPGSTLKALIMAAALDSKVVKTDTKCPICAGPVQIVDYQIKTWNGIYRENISMVDVIRYSDNIGMVYVGKSLGLSRMLSYLRKFGVGSQTGIDLQGEVAQPLKPEENWYSIDLATVSFGQGISITPMQLLSAFSAIANEGRRMEPHVVSKIETTNGETIAIQPKVLDTPISPTTAKVMTEILVNAVNNGEAKWTRLKGYRVAGKTGTAQIPIAGHYDPNKTIASFIGFAPADKPKFVMLVIIDRPTTSIYGSETAAPLFFDIANDILTYYNIPPAE